MSVFVTCEVTSGPDKIRKIWLSTGKSISVGHGEGADYAFVHDTQMSNMHFRLICDEDTCSLVDLDSTSGTYLNGSRVAREYVQDLDTITAGMTSFCVRIDSRRKSRTTSSNQTVQLRSHPSPNDSLVKDVKTVDAHFRDDNGSVTSTPIEPTIQGPVIPAENPRNEPVPAPKSFELSPAIPAGVVPSHIAEILKLLKESSERKTPPPLGAILSMLTPAKCGGNSDKTATQPVTITGRKPSPAWSAGCKLQLVVQQNGQQTMDTVALRVGQVLIVGKAAECDLTIANDETMADKHFLISCNESDSTLFDFGSGRTTMVNDELVGQHKLSDGDTIVAGKTLFWVQMR